MPPSIQVFERGWLSSNGILLRGRHGLALVDSGYATHAGQTLELIQHALAGEPLDLLVNTHLHSDHCGGNAALQARWPGLPTLIPAATAEAVAHWDEAALTFQATGQQCPRFSATGTLQHGDLLALGDAHWQVHAAPGHDPDMVVLFEPESATLISADALWENGFGVIFPEIEGEHAFETMAQTLDIIERLRPRHVIPGHGRPFDDAAKALAVARKRLDGFVRDPVRHAHHAAKVLVKFKLLEWQRIHRDALHAWGQATPYLQRLRDLTGAGSLAMPEWLDALLAQLVRSEAARIDADGWIADH